jgi:hypothetical protein
MTNSGNDRIELMKSLNITVLDGTGDDNLYLGRYGIYIPYNITNFMLFEDSQLVSDVLRRFREKQMDFKPTNDIKGRVNNFLKNKIESDRNQITLYEKENKVDIVDNFKLKKKKIKDKLIEKGLMCLESK